MMILDSVFADDVGSWTSVFQTSGTVGIAALLVLACCVFWMTNLIAMPGNWICVLLVAIYAWVGPTQGRLAIGLGVVLSCFLLALLGEIVEFAAAAVGAQRAGASRKSTLYSIAGSVCGAVAGALIGIPIPFFGPVIAAILFGGLGAAAGAMYGEWNDGRPWKENWTVGHATFWGRLFGTLGKVIAGLVIVVVIAASVVL